MTARTPETKTAGVKSAIASDPLWFKNAVVYQLHVRAFCDANEDGVGDFRGLTQKLGYIQDLGVTAIWLQPFFYSPLRDDGYDIADYKRIHPSYGTMRDFEAFLREAHDRDLRVITELVMNHTSDQHEWFQKSRRSKPGERFRDYYVWSDTDEKYQQARIIFQDFETSNWTWDPAANAYFWHRFYHHQPDLNFDNPEVREAMFDTIDFWMDKGIDGVRLDAVPYLYEREGTNCENLPETHEFLRALRTHIDNKYSDKMLLAEANQWPEDAAAYFGAGDECHMNFHFPLMPRLFMAIEREDRFPIIDILEQTPQIPENCQWGIFLRNHDELTLEMVTDEERDYMYRTFAEDPRARVNLGIRRRLAPLLRDNRRKMELMNALLMSLPGTPILYYGDEIRMGDNIYLGDRDGVRTPMHWSDDRNAGFSRANPQRLYLPVIIDAQYHYAARNVDVEQRGPHSMLWWMRRIIALRKQHLAFGQGTIEFLTPDNSKVLAFLRQHEDETILAVANISRFAQCAELELSRFRGRVPVELFGHTKFPPIGELPYFLTFGPYSFYWFRLEFRNEESEPLAGDLPKISLDEKWDDIFAGRPLSRLEAALPAYLKRQRWFAGKARTIRKTKVLDAIEIKDGIEALGDRHGQVAIGTTELPPTRVMIVRVDYNEGEPENYLLPILFAQGEQEFNIQADRPGAGIVKVEIKSDESSATLCDTTHESAFWQLLHDAIVNNRTLPGRNGEVVALQTQALSLFEFGRASSTGEASDSTSRAETTGGIPVTVHVGEQSNTSAVLGGRYIMKMFRRIREGENPDWEVGRFLTEKARLTSIPQVAGAVEYIDSDGDHYTLAILHELVSNEGDAWVFTLDELDRYLERVESELAGMPSADVAPTGLSLLSLSERTPPPFAQELIGPFLQSAKLLGTRTAELHVALATGIEPGFVPEPFTKLYQRSLFQSMRAQARRTLDLLAKRLPALPDFAFEPARKLVEENASLLDRFRNLVEKTMTAKRIRCHGDFHLGQVLFTGKDFAIIDFEGEPDRSIGERKIKASPLRDVAGMIRSFHYAAHVSLSRPHRMQLGPSANREVMIAWLNVWFLWSAAAFLRAYLVEAVNGNFLPTHRDELETLLNVYLLEKAVYELNYELNNRPDWVAIPIEGILHLISN